MPGAGVIPGHSEPDLVKALFPQMRFEGMQRLFTQPLPLTPKLGALQGSTQTPYLNRGRAASQKQAG
jgi:hypothetical protein